MQHRTIIIGQTQMTRHGARQGHLAGEQTGYNRLQIAAE
jgi:hypothetical protein